MTVEQRAETRRLTWGFCAPTDSGMEIISLSRGSLRIHARGRTLTLGGEAMTKGAPVHFYVDLASARQWDNGMLLTDAEREEIMRELPDVAWRKGWILAVD